MKRALTITGPFRGITGHDNTTRSIVRALHNRGVQIELRDLPQWSPAKLKPEHQDPWFEQFSKPIGAEVNLHICMPQQVKRSGGERTVNLTMFEADRIPASWAEHSLTHDLIIVPVESSRQAWERSGIPSEKIALCPLGVDTNRFSPGVKPVAMRNDAGRSLCEFKTRFLNISDAIDRKNLLGLLRVWLISTDKDDDAVLILKPGFYTRGSQARYQQKLEELENSVRKSMSQAAPIFLVPSALPINAMPAVFASATHYISLSRGEGFDLPMVEAGASGLQLIAPRHSAYLDYLTDRIAHLVPVQAVEARVPSDPATGEFFESALWWEPEHDSAVSIVRDIIDGTAPKKEPPFASLSQLTWEKTAERLEQLLFAPSGT